MDIKPYRTKDFFTLTTALTEARYECATDSLIVGCVLSGIKHIEADGVCVTLHKGDMFFVGKGVYAEINIPVGAHAYSDITASFSAHELRLLQNQTRPMALCHRGSAITERIGKIANVLNGALFEFFEEQERAMLGFRYSFFPELGRQAKLKLINLLRLHTGDAFAQIVENQTTYNDTIIATECDIIYS